MRHGEEQEWDAITQDYVRIVRDNTGATPEVALRAAAQMVRAFRQRFGGTELYVSSPPRYVEADVLADIRATPGQIPQVCSKHGIHKATLYRLLERARQRGESVPDLPAQEPKTVNNAAAPAPVRRRDDPPFNW